VIALTRAVSDRFAEAISALAPVEPIDVARARTQHAAYLDALRALGAEVVVLDGEPAYPDSVFIEDTAVVARGLAVVTRPGAPTRQGEVEAVARALERLGDLEIARMAAPATLDGGDCLRLRDTIYVGRSARTSAEGVAALRALFAPRGVRIVPVELPANVLHLKCVCSPLANDRVLLARDTVPAGTFEGAEVVWVPAEELYAANAVAVADRGVIVADGYPRAREALSRAGFRTIAVATSEASKADGSLTCQSILIAD
jgi:dimethylargininase